MRGLVLLAALLLSDLVAVDGQVSKGVAWRINWVVGGDVHVLGEALEVLLLLLELLLELNELLLLALADGVVLVGLLSSLEGVTVEQRLGSIDVLLMRIDANPSAAGGRNLPRTAGLGRSTGSTLGHDAGGGREASNGPEGGRLAEGCSEHGC